MATTQTFPSSGNHSPASEIYLQDTSASQMAEISHNLSHLRSPQDLGGFTLGTALKLPSPVEDEEADRRLFAQAETAREATAVGAVQGFVGSLPHAKREAYNSDVEQYGFVSSNVHEMAALRRNVFWLGYTPHRDLFGGPLYGANEKDMRYIPTYVIGETFGEMTKGKGDGVVTLLLASAQHDRSKKSTFFEVSMSAVVRNHADSLAREKQIDLTVEAATKELLPSANQVTDSNEAYTLRAERERSIRPVEIFDNATKLNPAPANSKARKWFYEALTDTLRKKGIAIGVVHSKEVDPSIELFQQFGVAHNIAGLAEGFDRTAEYEALLSSFKEAGV